jgi:hypothetical protein
VHVVRRGHDDDEDVQQCSASVACAQGAALCMQEAGCEFRCGFKGER